MKYIITERQILLISENLEKDLRLSLGEKYSKLFDKIEKLLLKNNVIRSESKNFFRKVVTNDKYFNTVTLGPGNEEYEKRLEELKNLRDIFKSKNCCSKMVNTIEQDIKSLPNKGLIMTLDNEDKYSLLNRLDTHYTSKSYLLTKIIFDSLELRSSINIEDVDEKKLVELLLDIMTDSKVDTVSEYLYDLLESNENFKHFFFGVLEFSRERGYKLEHEFIDRMRAKYGYENVIEFSNDFGFVDYFGIDVVLIYKNKAYPVQLSTKKKNYPKIFKYNDYDCTPLGFYKEGNGFVRYTKENI